MTTGPDKRDGEAPRKVVRVEWEPEPAAAPVERLSVRGDILEEDEDGERRRLGWFRLEQADLPWLPMRESAFLLWVLVLLVLVWIVIGLVLRFG
jgi:hypothetical protein